MKLTPKLLPVRIYGDAILRQKLPESDPQNPELQSILPDIIHTMYERDGVGLAANQVGLTYRLFVIDPYWARENATPNPIVMINPVIESQEGELSGEEGCISLPGIYADVHRAAKITCSYTDQHGERHSKSAEGFEAVVIQHEYDHLEGIVFTDRISPLAKLKNGRKLKELAAKAVDGVNIMEGLPQ